jgi:hypothetical protein
MKILVEIEISIAVKKGGLGVLALTVLVVTADIPHGI